jgi:hypothetical protein
VKKGNAYGVLVHAMIAVDAARGPCLGLVGGDVWSRDGVNPIPHGQRPLAERGAAHWADTAQRAKQVVQSASMLTVVGDREADIYELFARVPDARTHVLIRAEHNRALAGKRKRKGGEDDEGEQAPRCSMRSPVGPRRDASASSSKAGRAGPSAR